ncbi:hypothetical protein ACKWTF_014366 [Chironomus riparius]
MKFYIIYIIFLKFCSADLLDSSKLLFIGQNYNDVKNLTINLNFNRIFNTNYFNPSKLSVLIIHGFEGSYETRIGKSLVDSFLTRPEYNVIFADWSERANGGYLDVVYVMSEVAQKFVRLLNKIQTFGYDLSKIYIVGHSLGAHMAGRIGTLLQSQNVFLPRITGLDPAGPLFNWTALIMKIFGSDVFFPRFKPLTKGNAKFVDIIHSNAGWFRGLMFSTGDVDFWPNGGSIQPMCTGCGFLNLFKNLDKCSSCHHLASAFYYAESVRSSESIFTARRCKSGSILPLAMLCRGPEVASMGFYASRASRSGDYYLTTKATAPYSY